MLGVYAPLSLPAARLSIAGMAVDAHASSIALLGTMDKSVMRQKLPSRGEIASDTPLRLATGETRTYYYAWRRDPRIDAQPGTPDFIRCYQEAT
jgi:hypothetical protein